MSARAAIAALALAAAAATTASAPIADASAPSQPQHIVLIVADDLGWNDVGFHAGANGRTQVRPLPHVPVMRARAPPRRLTAGRALCPLAVCLPPLPSPLLLIPSMAQVPTPNLDKLAARGVRLGSYFVQPTCSPTRSSIMTGRHVTHMGIYQPNLGPDNTRGVPFELPFLPEQLRALGFATHAVGKWHLGTFDRRLVPTGRGFDSFLGYYGGAEDYFSHEAINASDFHFDEGLQLRPFMQAVGRYSTHLYAERAVKVIEDFARAKERRDAAATASQRRLRGVGASGGNDRLFLYLSWQAIHAPDQVPPEYEERFSKTISDKHRRTVAGMIACMDDAIGNVTAALDAEGMLDDTLVVFTTDNGGPAANFNKNMASNWPLRGMKVCRCGAAAQVAAILSPRRARADSDISLAHIVAGRRARHWVCIWRGPPEAWIYPRRSAACVGLVPHAAVRRSRPDRKLRSALGRGRPSFRARRWRRCVAHAVNWFEQPEGGSAHRSTSSGGGRGCRPGHTREGGRPLAPQTRLGEGLSGYRAYRRGAGHR